MLKKYMLFVASLYKVEVAALALSLFRITYGFVLFADILQIFYFRHLIFDPIPYVQEAIYMITPMLIFWLLSIVFLILGLLTKVAAIANYLFTVLFLGFSFHIGSISEHNYHVDTEFIPIAFVLMFMPVSRRLSLDRLIEKIKYSTPTKEHFPKNTVSKLNYVVLILVAGLIYFDSVFYKLYSPMWLNGLGVWLPSSLPWGTYLDLSIILNSEYLMKFLGYLTLVFQITYIFFVWIEKTKVFYLLVGIGLHIGIAIAFPIPWFALAMVALYIGIIPSSFYSSIYKKYLQGVKRPTLIFYFDENCPLCHRLRIMVEYFDNGRTVNFLSAQEHAHNVKELKIIPIQELLDNVYSIDDKYKVYKGIDTYHKVMNRVWILRPFGLLMYLPFVKALCAKIYGYIAAHRITYGCTVDTCYMPTQSNQFIQNDDSKIKILQTLDLETIKVYLVGVFLVFIVISQLIMLQNSLLVNYFYKKTNMPRDVVMYLNSGASLYKSIFYPFLGVSQHGVFMDSHFENYTHTVAVVYVKDDGKEVFLPIIDEKGQASWYNTGRQWVNYSFRVSNRDFDPKQYTKGIQKYIYFWAHKNSIDLENANFKILYKYNDVPYKWEKDLLKNALDKPWKNAGTLGWKDGMFYANIKELETEN